MTVNLGKRAPRRHRPRPRPGVWPRPDRQRRTRLFAAAALVLGVLVPSAVAPAAAEAAPPGPEWAVSLGDSFISGEAGRWAGNSADSTQVDALGPTAYHDTAAGESTPGCHRSGAAEIHIGVVNSANLACSGSGTRSSFSPNGQFKPGLDFFDDGLGHRGQALALQQFAAERKVRMITVSVGGNDFGFTRIVAECLTAYTLSTTTLPVFCSDDPTVRANFSPANVEAISRRIAAGLQNIRTAMTRAGYADADYTVVVQNYPNPLPGSAAMAYPEADHQRLPVGCGLWNRDLDMAQDVAVPAINTAVSSGTAQSGLTNAVRLDVTGLLAGHRLCETGTAKLDHTTLPSWRSAGASDLSEWVSEIRIAVPVLSPQQLQEDLHPNYWAQLALRNCLRQVFGTGTVAGGSCVSAGPGLTALGEPPVLLSR